MTEKRVSVRLSATGGQQVRAELERVGEAGARGFGRLGTEMEAANRRLAAFAQRVRVALAAAGAAAAAGATLMVRSALQTVDAQAKLALSINSTVEGIQALTWAGELAGVSLGDIEQAVGQLTRRLSQAASGTGPAVEALRRLQLTASELQALPADRRIALIQERLADLVPEAERAAVAAQLFGDRASLVFTRIDGATLRAAAQDVRDFGVAVSDVDAAQIERANDAVARLGLVWTGIGNRLAVAVAPAIEAVATALADMARVSGPIGQAVTALFDNLGRLASYAATFAAFMAGRWVAGLAAAALSVRGLATALVVLRGALIRTGIGALIVGAGELVYWFVTLIQRAGGLGSALTLLGEVVAGVWEGIVGSAAAIPSGLAAYWAQIKLDFLNMIVRLRDWWGDFLASLADSLQSSGLNIGGVLDGVADRLSRASANVYRGTQRMSRQVNEAMNAAAAAQQVYAANMEQAWARARRAMSALLDVLSATETVETPRNVARALNEINEVLAQTPTRAGGARTALEQVGQAAQAVAEQMRQVEGAFEHAFVGLITGANSAREVIASLLRDLARLLAQAAFRRLTAGLFAPGGALGRLFGAIFHDGGVVGETTAPMRAVPAAAFIGAPRMHSGGWAGLRPDEVPAILQRGERVLSRRELARAGAGPDAMGGLVQVVVRVANDGGMQAFVERTAGNVAAATVRAYDGALPDRIAAFQANPRRRG